jgi:hypothetical protein
MERETCKRIRKLKQTEDVKEVEEERRKKANDLLEKE